MPYPVQLADGEGEVVGSEAGQGLLAVHPKQLGHALIDEYLPAALYPKPSPAVLAWLTFAAQFISTQLAFSMSVAPKFS